MKNRVTILRSRQGWHCDELGRALERQGAAVRFASVEELKCRSGFGPGQASPLADCDALVIRGIPAGSAEQIIYRMDALYTLQRRGLPCINSPKTIEKTVDKYLTTALLEAAGLPVPPTICCEGDEAAIREAFAALGGDVIYKPLFGSCGHGLMRLTRESDAEPLAHMLGEKGGVAYLQRFIPCSNSDIRAFVLGGEVIAAMRRTGDDWFANCSRGGRAQACTLSAYEEELAVKAAAVVEGDVVGVDIIRGDDGSTYVIEANGCPGWKGLSAATGVDVAGEMAAYVLRRIS